jgi:hypothetical protein
MADGVNVATIFSAEIFKTTSCGFFVPVKKLSCYTGNLNDELTDEELQLCLCCLKIKKAKAKILNSINNSCFL